MTKLADLQDIPTLEGGWINLTEAAELLGYTRSYMYKKASRGKSLGGFSTLRRIGNQASYVINQSEVDDLLANSAALAVEEKPAKAPRKKKTLEEQVLANPQIMAEVQEHASGTGEVIEEEEPRSLSIDEVLSKI